MTILGARPQFIKAAAISRAIARLNCSEVQIEELIVHTGQHYDADMSDVFFREMNICGREIVYKFISNGRHF